MSSEGVLVLEDLGCYRGGPFLCIGGVLFRVSGALDSSHVLLPCPITSLASHITIILISTLL